MGNCTDKDHIVAEEKPQKSKMSANRENARPISDRPLTEKVTFFMERQSAQVCDSASGFRALSYHQDKIEPHVKFLWDTKLKSRSSFCCILEHIDARFPELEAMLNRLN
jgi:hypothetical protein